MAEKQDVEALGGQLSNIVNRLRKSAVKGATGGLSAGTTVRSVFGYQRWTRTGDDTTSSDDVQNTELAEHTETTSAEESLPLNAEAASEDVADTDTAENSSPSDGVLSKSSTCTSESMEEPAEQAVTKVDSISEWQAGWNVTNAIQGMFIVSFPYAVHQGGYWAILAMLAVAGICCYTGKILVECLYETGKDGIIRRVRASYGDIAECVLGRRFGKLLVNTAQVIELLMTCILYVLLSGELLKGSFSTKSMPLSGWVCLSTIPLLFCAFLKTMRRVSWLSLWCSVAHMLINIIIIVYCFTLVKQWQPRAVKINPDIWTVPISLGIIVFSYTSQIFLPTLEGKMVKRNRFSCMMHWTHIAAAVFKAVFSYIGYVTWGEETEEVITNNLPTKLKITVNIILVIKALFSYPLPYFAAVDIIEQSFFDSNTKTVFPSCYEENLSIKWWGMALRVLLVTVTMLLAIFIPHFALLMGLIGSFTGTMLSFVLPCIFYLYLKRDILRWYVKLWLVVVILLGVLCGVMGVYYSFRALVLAFQGRSVVPWNRMKSFSRINALAANETLKSSLLG